MEGVRWGTEGRRMMKEGGREVRTINLVPGPCAYRVGRQGSPGDNLSPWISVQMAGQGTRRTPLIDLGGKTENLALLLARRAPTVPYKTCMAASLLLSFSSSSQVICANPKEKWDGVEERVEIWIEVDWFSSLDVKKKKKKRGGSHFCRSNPLFFAVKLCADMRRYWLRGTK